MNYHKAQYLTSAARLNQLPPDTGCEVAFAGRSNVGKSSALNVLTQQKTLARTSKTPGRTQLINFFNLDDENRLVDLPGYGYAKVHASIRQRWQQTLSQYLQSRQCLQGVILLMDIRHPLREFDEMMLDWASHYQIPIHILLTKADKLGRGAAMNTFHQVQKELKDYPDVSIQLFSALKKTGLKELEEQLDQWYSE